MNNSCAQHSSKHSLSFLLSANNLEVIKVTFVSNLYEANAVIFFFFFSYLYHFFHKIFFIKYTPICSISLL